VLAAPRGSASRLRPAALVLEEPLNDRCASAGLKVAREPIVEYYLTTSGDEDGTRKHLKSEIIRLNTRRNSCMTPVRRFGSVRHHGHQRAV